MKTRCYTYGSSDIDMYLISDSTDHIQTSEKVFDVLKTNWNRHGTLTVKEQNRRLLNFPLHFQASEDCDVTVINTISSESDFCHPTTQAASRVLARKALSCNKSDMWSKVKSTELRRVVNILKRMMKFTISKRTRTSGCIVEFISLRPETWQPE